MDIDKILDENNPYMLFGRKRVINYQIRVSTSANRQAAAILAAILLSFIGQNLYGESFKSNSCVQFGRNRVKINEYKLARLQRSGIDTIKYHT